MTSRDQSRAHVHVYYIIIYTHIHISTPSVLTTYTHPVCSKGTGSAHYYTRVCIEDDGS